MGRFLRILANPRAAEDFLLREAITNLYTEGQRCELVPIDGPDRCPALTREAIDDGVDVVVAAGGDGTLHEVVNAVHSTASEVTVGVLPFGTANDFATANLVPKHPMAALRMLLSAEIRAIDLLRCADRVVVNALTGGFGSQITHETPAELKSMLGGLAYLLTGVARLPEMSAHSARIRAEGLDWRGDLFGVGVGNGATAGGGFTLDAAARLDDGVFGGAILPAFEVGELVENALDENPAELFVRFTGRWLELEADAPVHFSLDGEPYQSRTLRVELLPRAVPFVLPPESPLLGAADATAAD